MAVEEEDDEDSDGKLHLEKTWSLFVEYQCFDFNNFVEINSRRPSWRCPHCNQCVCFTDLRIDQNMVKVLKEVGENVVELTEGDGDTEMNKLSSRENEDRKPSPATFHSQSTASYPPTQVTNNTNEVN